MKRRKEHIAIFWLGFVLLIVLVAFGVYGVYTQKAQGQAEEKENQIATLEASLQQVNAEKAAIQEELDQIYSCEQDLDTAVVEEEEEEEDTGTGASYEKKYPELYAGLGQDTTDPGKIIYLTFDDGPSSHTPEILSILDEYGVKATFFVVYRTLDPYASYYQKILDQGSTIGIHTATHDYEGIYKSVGAYLKDFKIVRDYVEEKTGTVCDIFRFPGGSKNSYNKKTYKDIIGEMERRGFVYFDWNVSGEDATGSATVDSITKNVLGAFENERKHSAVVLLHDTKEYTVEALPGILEKLTKDGYEFRVLDQNVTPVQFGR